MNRITGSILLGSFIKLLINKIITNKKMYNQLRYNSYRAHIDEFNFEKQFKKINDRLNILR